MFIFLYTVFRNSSISDEHVFCVALHFTIGHKLSFYFWAIILHAAIDFLAGAYQLGIVSNLLLIELILAIYVLGIGLLTRRIWRKEETHGLI